MIAKKLRHDVALKQRLFEFALGSRCLETYKLELLKRSGDPPMHSSELGSVNFADWFLLQFRFPDGDTVVDKFVREDGSATEEDKATLLRWKGVIEGTFRVVQVMPHGYSLIDPNGREFSVKRTVAKAKMQRIEQGNVMKARLVPYEDYHLFSGAVLLIDPVTIELLARMTGPSRE